MSPSSIGLDGPEMNGDEERLRDSRQKIRSAQITSSRVEKTTIGQR